MLNNYVGRDRSQVERRGDLLKRYGMGRKNNQYSSQEQLVYESVGRMPN